MLRSFLIGLWVVGAAVTAQAQEGAETITRRTELVAELESLYAAYREAGLQGDVATYRRVINADQNELLSASLEVSGRSEDELPAAIQTKTRKFNHDLKDFDFLEAQRSGGKVRLVYGSDHKNLDGGAYLVLMFSRESMSWKVGAAALVDYAGLEKGAPNAKKTPDDKVKAVLTILRRNPRFAL